MLLARSATALSLSAAAPTWDARYRDYPIDRHSAEVAPRAPSPHRALPLRSLEGQGHVSERLQTKRVEKNHRNKTLVLWKDRSNWQPSSKTDKGKEREYTNYQEQKWNRKSYRSSRPQKGNKRTPWKTLHIKSWCRGWNEPNPQKGQISQLNQMK